MRHRIPQGVGEYPYVLSVDGHTAIIKDTGTIVWIFSKERSEEAINEIVKHHNENLLLGVSYIDFNQESKQLINNYCIEKGMSDKEALDYFALWGFSL